MKVKVKFQVEVVPKFRTRKTYSTSSKNSTFGKTTT